MVNYSSRWIIYCSVGFRHAEALQDSVASITSLRYYCSGSAAQAVQLPRRPPRRLPRRLPRRPHYLGLPAPLYLGLPATTRCYKRTRLGDVGLRNAERRMRRLSQDRFDSVVKLSSRSCGPLLRPSGWTCFGPLIPKHAPPVCPTTIFRAQPSIGSQ